jgi:uncharacterized protein (DUF1800 family)
MTAATDATLAANRFGLGARPGELAGLASGARDALFAQLKGPAPHIVRELPASHEVLAQVIALREERRKAGDDDAAAQVKVAVKIREVYGPVYVNEALARFQAAVTSERSFVERLVQFWSNHFAVSIDKVAVLGLAGAMEREAIRPHVLGRFPDMLRAVEQHPAMLLYLDNHLSIGPQSRAARLVQRRGNGRELGLNENLGREILELHTLGVEGGYTQQDVTTLAAIITGWSIGGSAGRLRGGDPGRFYFREAFHEPEPKTLLGRRYREDGLAQGEAALRDLARHPQTARHLATKLARHFIADDPPAAVVDRIARAFEVSEGDLPTVYRALLDAPQAWEPASAKFKTPADYIQSAYRALTLPVENERRGLAAFELLGQRTFQPGSPAGWPDRSADWDGSSALLKRIEWANAVGQRLGSRVDALSIADAALGASLTDATRTGLSRAQDGAQALTLLLSSPEFMRR